MSSTDRIEKQITLKAPVSKVWTAITDAKAFSAWFKASFTEPFVEGQVARGVLTFKGYEGTAIALSIEKIQPETLFTYRWHPFALDASRDYSSEEKTLVEFRLASAPGGTLLTIIESGFDKIPASRRAEAFRANDGGWSSQIKNIEAYVAA